MLKRICIILFFMLLLLNGIEVKATSADEEIVRNSTLKLRVDETGKLIGVENVTVEIKEIQTGISKLYTTNEEGIIFIEEMAAGEITINVISVPDEYILNTTEYRIQIRENTKEVYSIALNHAVGSLLIKCKPWTTYYIYDSEGILLGEYGIGDEGEQYISIIDTGDYVLKQKKLGEEETIEDLEFTINKNELCIIDLLELQGVITSDNNETEDTEKTDDNIENAEESADMEKDNIETGNDTQDKEENVNNDDEILEEIKDNLEIEKEENSVINNIKGDEELENKEENENTLDIIEQDTMPEKIETDNLEITEEEIISNEDKVENISNLDKLPRTGNDYFITKIVITDVLVLAIFLFIIILYKKKTDYKIVCYTKTLKDNAN